MARSSPLVRVRKICLALPDTNERESHGSPTFFIRDKRSFVTYVDNHHDDGRLALWCASPSDVQQMLATSRPEQFFVPPYVGHLGWIGVRLDRDLDWDEIAGVIKDAHKLVAGKMPRPRSRAAERPDDVTLVLDPLEGISPFTEPERYARERAKADEAFRRFDAAMDKERRRQRRTRST